MYTARWQKEVDGLHQRCEHAARLIQIMHQIAPITTWANVLPRSHNIADQLLVVTTSTVNFQLYLLLLTLLLHMSTHADTSQVPPPDTSPPDASLPQALGRQKQLSDFEKGKIVFAYEQGWSYQRIADYIGWSKSAVHSFIKRYIEQGTYENEKVLGRPEKISEATENIILDLIEGDRSNEHVWAWMKHQLHQRFPHSMNMPGGPTVVKEALADALQEVWRTFQSRFWRVCIPLCLAV